MTKGKYTPCNYFNAFVVSKNGVPQGTSCSFYSKPMPASYAKDVGQYDQAGNQFTVSNSFGYALAVQDYGVIAEEVKA